MQTERQRVHSEALHKFGLADLTPVESSMIDTVLNETVGECADVLRREHHHDQAELLERRFKLLRCWECHRVIPSAQPNGEPICTRCYVNDKLGR